MRKKALIIGAAGFVGPYLAAACQKNLDADVIGTKLEREKLELNAVEGHRTEVLNLDIMDGKAVLDLLDETRPQYIFHLAAQSSVAYSWKNPELTVDVNVKGALHLLEALRTLQEKDGYNPQVLIVGSSEEYGRPQTEDGRIDENHPVHPVNIYAATKVCQNMLATIYAEAYGLNLVMTRSFNHIGPGQAPIFVVADFCQQVARIERGEQKPVIRVGNLSAKRDFTDVRDVVNVYASLIEHGESGETYNVGTGQTYSIQEILNMIIAESSMDINVEVDEHKLRPVDVPIIEPKIKRLVKVTGWSSNFKIKETIKDMLNFFRQDEI